MQFSFCFFKRYLDFFLLKVPAFEAADGTPIYESNAIAYYGIVLLCYNPPAHHNYLSI